MAPKWGVDLYTGSTYTRVNTVYALIHEETKKPVENPLREAESASKEQTCGKKIILRAYPSQTMAYTTRNTVIRLMCNELNLNPVVQERSKEK